MKLAEAVYTALTEDGVLASLLPTWRGQPTVFLQWPVPAVVPRPYVYSAGSIADVPEDAQSYLQRSITRDFVCVADNPGGTGAAEAIAEAVRACLHGAEFAIEGGKLLVTRCTGPVLAPSDASVAARIVSATFLVNQTA